jgi:starch phosphorylase
MELYHRLKNKEDRLFSYFTMEVGLIAEMATYSGGLGVLAGDTIKSFADRSVPTVCVTMLNEKGYFKQKLDEFGNQIETDYDWDKEKYLMKLDTIVEVKIENRIIKVGAWEYRVKGHGGYEIPVYFLDTDIEGNSEYDKTLTKHLYGGDEYYRLCQEIVLGVGGVKYLDARGYKKLLKYHMNEGHAAFLTLELLRKEKGNKEKVIKKCVFTTHTPVAAGHDTFPKEMVQIALGNFVPEEYYENNRLSMTHIGFSLSHYINGVAKKHGEVSKQMFPQFNIDYITNGVHSETWTVDSFKKVFDDNVSSWRNDPYALRYATQINLSDIWEAHKIAKKEFFDEVRKTCNVSLDEEVFTIGFARRSTSYKRMDLLFRNISELLDISRNVGKIQLVFAGKAHVRDTEGKELIKKIYSYKNIIRSDIKLVYLENYNMDIAKKMIAGVDLWLNTPRRPMEASGTSGMKAAHNGVPSLSVLDGWWIEGHIENYTGWSIGSLNVDESDDEEAKDLYFKLEKIIVPMYYQRRDDFIKIMRNAIAYNASFFNTSRMVSQYVLNAYLGY